MKPRGFSVAGEVIFISHVAHDDDDEDGEDYE